MLLKNKSQSFKKSQGNQNNSQQYNEEEEVDDNEIDQFNLKKHLHFGATIYLKPAYQQSNHVIFSNGFVDEDIFLSNDQIINESNIMDDCLFTIVPVSSITEYYSQLEEMFDPIQNSSIPEDKKLNYVEQILDNFQNQVKNPQEKNIKYQCTPLQYNQTFQLEHVKTKKYLTFNPKKSFQMEQDSIITYLSDTPSIYSRLRIIPCYNYQNEKDKYILFDTDCFITAFYQYGQREVLGIAIEDSFFEKFQFHSFKRNKGYMKDSFQDQDDNSTEIQPFQIYMSLEKKQKMREGLQAKKLYFGDVVWIVYNELMSCIAFSPENQEKNQDMIYFDQSDNNQMYNNSIGLWKIEGLDPFNGKELCYKQQIRFKNINTGYYLAYGEGAKFLQSTPAQGIRMEKQKSSASVFYLESIDQPSSTKPIYQNSFFKIFHQTSKRLLGKEQIEQTFEFPEISFRPILKDNQCQEDVFRFTIANETEIWECYYLKSCKPKLKMGLNLLIKKQEQEQEIINRQQNISEFYKQQEDLQLNQKEKIILVELINGLILLQKFCFDGEQELNTMHSQTPDSGYVFNQNVGSDFEKIYKRQKLLREQGYMDLLSKIIENCFSTKEQLNEILLLNQEEILEETQPSQQQILFGGQANRFSFQNLQTLGSRNSVKPQMRQHTPSNSTPNNPDKKKAVIELLSESIFQNELKNFYQQQESNYREMRQKESDYFLKEKVKICIICYELIQNLCQDNQENSEECVKHFTIFKNQIGYIRNATRCLIQILSNNEKLLSLIYRQSYETNMNNMRKTLPILQSRAGSSDSPLRKKGSFTIEQNNLAIGSMHSSISDKKFSLSKLMSQKSYTMNYKKNTLIHFIINRYEQVIEIILNAKNKKRKKLSNILSSQIFGGGMNEYFEEFLDILNTLCCYKEEGITINQQLIKNLLQKYFGYSDTNNKWKIYSRLIIPIKIEKQQGEDCLMVGLERQDKLEWFELSNLFSSSSLNLSPDQNQKKQMTDLINYFEKQLILFSNLCYGRNYSIKNFLSKYFYDKILMKYVWDKDIIMEIRAALLRILLHLHIDSKPRSSIIIPMLTKVFEQQALTQKTALNSPAETTRYLKNIDIKSLYEKITNTIMRTQKDQSTYNSHNIRFKESPNRLENTDRSINLNQPFIKEETNEQSISYNDQSSRKQEIELTEMRVSEKVVRSSEAIEDSMDYQPDIIEDFLQAKDTLEETSLQQISKHVQLFFQNEKFTLQYCDKMALNMILTVRKLISFNFFEKQIEEYKLEAIQNSQNMNRSIHNSKTNKTGSIYLGEGQTIKKQLNQQQTQSFLIEKKSPFRSLIENLLRLLKSSLIKEEYFYDVNGQDIDKNDKDPIKYLKNGLIMMQKEINKSRNQTTTIQIEQKSFYSQLSRQMSIIPGQNAANVLNDDTNFPFRMTANFEGQPPYRRSSEKVENAYQIKTFRRHENKIFKILYKKIHEAENQRNSQGDEGDETNRTKKNTYINKTYGQVAIREPDITQQIKINLLRTLIYYQELREDYFIEKLVQFIFEVNEKCPYFSENEQIITSIVAEKLNDFLPSIMQTNIGNNQTNTKSTNNNLHQNQTQKDLKENRKESVLQNTLQSIRYFSQFQNQSHKQSINQSNNQSPNKPKGSINIGQGQSLFNPAFSYRRQSPWIPQNVPQNNQSSNNTFQALEDFDKLNNGPILPILIQLFYKEDDYTLNFLILKLIFKCFNQRALIFKELKHLQILTSKEEVEAFNSIKSKSIQLNFDCEQSEIWLKTPEKIADPKFQYKFIIHRVISNIQSFINFCDPNNKPDQENLNYLRGNINEISLGRQIILRNLRTYEIVINLIKESEYILKEIKEEQRNQCLLTRMIETCYNFLKIFIKNNNIYNKKILANYLEIFLDQQKDCIELGQTALICELYRNNYKLIYSVREDIIKQFLWKITDDDKKGGHDPLYLEFFEVILYYRRKPVKQNCEKFLNAIIEKYSYDIKNLLFLVEVLVPGKSNEGQDVSPIPIITPPPPMISINQTDKFEQIQKKIQPFTTELEGIKSLNESVVESLQGGDKTPDAFHKAIQKYLNKDDDENLSASKRKDSELNQLNESCERLNDSQGEEQQIQLNLDKNRSQNRRQSFQKSQNTPGNNFKPKINTEFIFEMKEVKAARDVPIVYQIKILNLLRNLFECLKEKQQILQILMQKTLSINYILELLNKKDIFSQNSKSRSTHRYILNTMMKQSLLRFASLVWLKQDKNYQEARNKNYIINFIKIETEKLSNISQADIDHFRTHKRTCYADRKRMHNKDNSVLANDTLQNQFNSNGSQNSQQFNKMFKNQQMFTTNVVNDEKSAKMLCDKYFNIEADFNSNYLSHIFGVVLPIVSFIWRNKYNNTASHIQTRSGSNVISGSFEKDIEMQVIAEFVTTFLHFFSTFISVQNLSELTQNEINALKEFGHEIQISLMEKKKYQEIEQNIANRINEENTNSNEFDPQFPSKNNENIENIIDLPLQDLIDQRSLKYDDDGIEKNWRSICINLLTNEQIKQDYIEPEINQLTYAFLNFQQQKEQQHQDESIQKFAFQHIDVLKRKFMLFIKATLDKNYDNSNFLRDEIPQSREIVIKLIQLLIDLLKARSNQMKNQEDKVLIQNQFQEQENLTTLISILCNEQTHPSIFFALINLAIELLEGGNQKIQEGFYEYFLKNPESENFFYKIYHYLSEEIQNIKREISLNERIKLANKKIVYCFKHKIPNKTTRILRFLQLLTENHNANLQNYMYTQSGSRTSYDLLNLIVQLVENLVENINQDNYDKLVQCFDTLTEFIQGPSEENQKALSEGRFLEIATKLLKIENHIIQKETVQKNKISAKKRIIGRFYTSSVNLLNQSRKIVGVQLNSYDKHVISYIEKVSPKFSNHMKLVLQANGKYQEDWMVSRLQYKCLITIESILEGNRDYKIMQKLLKVMPITIISSQIISIFKNYKALYGNSYDAEAFNHVELSTNLNDYSSEFLFMANTCLIIESGFKLYLIFRKVMEYFQHKQTALFYLSQHPNNVNASSYDQTLQQIEFHRQLNELNQETILDIQKILYLENERYKKNSFAYSLFNDKNDGQCHKITLSESDIKQDSTQFVQSLVFFINHSGYVEINFDNRIQKVYFPISPYCECLTKDDIKSLVDTIDRTSQRTKQVDLMNKSKKIIASMKQEYKNRTRLKKLIMGDLFHKLNIKTSKLRTLSSYLSFIQNMIFLGSTSSDHSFYLHPTFLQTSKKNNVVIVNVLQIVQVICECLQVAIYLLVFGFYANKFIPLINIEANQMIKKNNLQNSRFKFFYKLKFFLSDIQLMYRLMFLIFAILGIFHFVFIALLLLDFFVRTPLLRNVFKAVWVPRKQLFYTMVLYILMQYFFAILGYYTIYEEIQSTQNVDLCDDLWQCFSMIVDMTFKNDGGFVGILNRDNSAYKGWGIDFRAIYDFMYAFFVCLLMIEILSGIIIDTFASLRGQQEQINYDILNYCIICGQDRQSSDKNQLTRGFTHHCKYIHNIWHYIYYIAYIEDKEKTEYTGIESYVSSQLKLTDAQWFPNEYFKICNQYKSNSERSDPEIEEQQDIKNQLKQMQQQINQISSKLSKLKK